MLQLVIRADRNVTFHRREATYYKYRHEMTFTCDGVLGLRLSYFSVTPNRPWKINSRFMERQKRPSFTNVDVSTDNTYSISYRQSIVVGCVSTFLYTNKNNFNSKWYYKYFTCFKLNGGIRCKCIKFTQEFVILLAFLCFIMSQKSQINILVKFYSRSWKLYDMQKHFRNEIRPPTIFLKRLDSIKNVIVWIYLYLSVTKTTRISISV